MTGEQIGMPTVSNSATAESLLFHTLLQLIFIMLAARVMGSVFVRLRQPRGVGEIVAGLLLGPSLFGALAPEGFRWLFLTVDPAPLQLLSQIGLILLMFQVGMEFDFGLLGDRANRRVAALVTVTGIVIPSLCGWGFGQLSADRLAPGISVPVYSLFIAIALSITAVPILGRILMEFGLTRNRIGVISIAAAAANDALGWVLLAAVAAVATHGFEPFAVLRQLGGLLIYLITSWYLLRPLLLRLVRSFSLESGQLPENLLAVLLIWVFGSALITSWLGIFAIFGGFVAGVLLHQSHPLVQAWQQRVGDLLAVFFLPIFFTYTGLRTDVGSLNTGEDWLWCAVLMAVAMLGKFGGCYLAARVGGLTAAESRCIGILMNTRALMELIVINLGRDLGVIPAKVFTMLVLMAVVSTLITAPGLRLWLPAALAANRR